METNTSKLVQEDDIMSNIPRAEPVPNSEPLSFFGAPNLKSKIFDTVVNISIFDSRGLSAGMEHNRKASDKHYDVETPTKAIQLALVYLHGYILIWFRYIHIPANPYTVGT